MGAPSKKRASLYSDNLPNGTGNGHFLKMDILDTYMDSSAIAAGVSKRQSLQFDIGLYYWMTKLGIVVFWSLVAPWKSFVFLVRSP